MDALYQKYRDYGRQEMKLYQYLDADGNFDYTAYKAAQIKTNHRKIDHVGPPRELIETIATYIKAHVPHVSFALCHGTRRGNEQRYFRECLHAEVMGTEISDTAREFPYTIEWDFHDIKEEWIESVDFIYSNSLDHSYDPVRCLQQWMRCLKVGGICVLGYSTNHSIEPCLKKKEAKGLLTEDNRLDILDQMSSKGDPFRATVKGYEFLLHQAVGNTCSWQVVQFCAQDHIVITKRSSWKSDYQKEMNMRKIFIDCGGHKATSVEFFRRVYPDAEQYQIYSFEANENFNRYFDKFKDVIYHNVAVWIADGEIPFYNSNGGSSTVIKGKAECGGFQDHKKLISCMDLSRWIASQFTREDYIILKMDIEGAEYDILDKMLKDNTIDFIDKLYIEWHCAKTNGEISLERHLRTLKGVMDRGLTPYTWCAHEALEAAKNGDHSLLSIDRLNRIATGGRAKQLLAQLNQDYNAILDKVAVLQGGKKTHLKTYAEYYKACKRHYLKAKVNNAHKLDLYNVGIHVYKTNEENELFSFPPNYVDIIGSLSTKIDKKVRDKAEHYDAGESDSAALSIKVANIWDLPELEQLANHFLCQLEQTVFKSWALVCAAHIYRNIPSDAERKSSWLWHYDNNPKEEIKLLIYLTDVTEDIAPFEYLRHKKTGEVIKMPTSRLGYEHWKPSPPMFPQSRIPDRIIDQLVTQGYARHKVIGPKGTVIFFDNNCIHRANVPVEGYRDVVIFNIRPVHFQIRPCITTQYTGSWMHIDPVIDPEQLTPVLR